MGIFKLIVPGFPFLEYLNTPLYFSRLRVLFFSLLVYFITFDSYLAIYLYVYLSITYFQISIKESSLKNWLKLLFIGFVIWSFSSQLFGEFFHQQYPEKFSFYLREPSFLAEYWVLILMLWRVKGYNKVFSLLVTLILYLFSNAEMILFYWFLANIFPVKFLTKLSNFFVYVIIRLVLIFSIYIVMIPISITQGSWRTLSNISALYYTKWFTPGYEFINEGMSQFGMPWIESVYSLAPLLVSKMGLFLGGTLLLVGEYIIFKKIKKYNQPIWYIGSLIAVWFSPKWLVVSGFLLILNKNDNYR